METHIVPSIAISVKNHFHAETGRLRICACHSYTNLNSNSTPQKLTPTQTSLVSHMFRARSTLVNQPLMGITSIMLCLRIIKETSSQENRTVYMPLLSYTLLKLLLVIFCHPVPCYQELLLRSRRVVRVDIGFQHFWYRHRSSTFL